MPLNILVCIKSVLLHPPASPVQGRLSRPAEACELNPFDRPAIETALMLRENAGGRVSLLSMGPPACAQALCEAMAMGADRAFLVCDPALAGSDTLATATTLAAAIRKLAPVDLVLFGTRTADSDTGQVGPQTAVLLNRPLVTFVHEVALAPEGLTVNRRVDGFEERYAVQLPAALTIHPRCAAARDVPLTGIRAAFEERPIDTLSLADLGLPPAVVGEGGSPTRVASSKRVSRERSCEFLTGSAEAQADELVRRMVAAGGLG